MIVVGQIGVGYWGPNLLRNLHSNKNSEVKLVIDSSEERRSYVKSIYPSINVGKNFNEILNDEDIDAVIISTPVSTHYDFTLRALKAGKNVLVEKPMATQSEQISIISKIAKEKQLVAMVGHTFLYNQAVIYVKKLIDSGALGDIRYIYSQRLNLGRIRNDVDALWNLAPHDISIIQYWLGEPEPISISKNGIDYVQNGIDDVVFMNIEYPNNIMVNIHVSWLDPHKVRKMTIVGSKKMIVYDDIADNKITIYDKGIDPIAVLGKDMDFDNPNSFSFHHRSGDVYQPKINWVEPLKTEIDHFISCIFKKAKCLTGPSHAKKVIKVLEAK
tara:strand:- start:1408 stop:2394 length:987 start_codon:yes stop_codon:yes gene_type:complete